MDLDLINRKHTGAWSLPFDTIDPAGADDYFVYIKNTHSTLYYAIHRVVVESTVVGSVEIHRVSGTAGGSPTARTPVSKHGANRRNPNIEFGDDPDITGFTALGILDIVAIEAASKDVRAEYSELLLIPPTQQVALMWDTGTGILSGSVHIVEIPNIEAA
jgi:hypothetical protein